MVIQFKLLSHESLSMIVSVHNLSIELHEGNAPHRLSNIKRDRTLNRFVFPRLHMILSFVSAAPRAVPFTMSPIYLVRQQSYASHGGRL
jgi:hypothetical protein